MLEVVCLNLTLGLFKYRFIIFQNPVELKDIIDFPLKLTATATVPQFCISGISGILYFSKNTVLGKDSVQLKKVSPPKGMGNSVLKWMSPNIQDQE